MPRFALNAILLLIGLPVAAAGIAGGHEEARALSEAGKIMPLEKILTHTHSHYIGRVLEAELENEDSGYYYEVEFVDDHGVVHKLLYDARSGELISDRPAD